MQLRYPRHAILAIHILAGACISATCQSSEPVCAEDDTKCDELTIEHIIVTATRRESLVERIPISVTAFSSDDLRDMGALEFEGYARSVPGLSFNEFGQGGKKYVIRGISSKIFSESRAATSVYLDETPVTDGGFAGLSYSPDPVLVDINRVEVLRGPQGTLFGSGSMGGAIRIITEDPNPDEFLGFAEASLSTTAHGGPGYQLQAMLNAPLSGGQAAIRAVAYYRDLDGWIDNTVLGHENVNDNRTVGARLAGTWSGAERLTVKAKLTYQDRQSNGSWIDQDDPPWTQQRLVPEPDGDEWALLNLNIHYRFDRAQLISVTSWMDRTVDSESDASAVYLGPDPFTTVTAVSRGEQQDFIQEFRLQSTGRQDLDWLLGLFYQHQDYRLTHELPAPGFDEMTGGLAAWAGAPDNLLVARTDRPSKQTAAFGDLIWRFGEHWEGTVGGRWFRFEHSSDSLTYGLLSNPPRSHQTHASESGFVPKIGLSYLPGEDLMFYGTIAGGYRPGGTNETVFEEFLGCRAELEWMGLSGIPQSYDSDSLWSYELGVKSGWASRKIYIKAAVFHIDWSEMQTSARLECGANWIQNAGATISRGAEFELAAYPGNNLQLTLNGAWTDARLDEDIPMGGHEGDRIPGVPEYAFGGSLSWFFDISAATEGIFRFDYQYVGSSPGAYWFVPNEIPSYSLVNLRLGLSRGHWDLALFVNNLFDERAIITKHSHFAGYYVTTARPLTAGISARFTY